MPIQDFNREPSVSSVPAIIITSHMTFLFSRFTQTITGILPTLVLIHGQILSHHHCTQIAAFFMHCIQAYHIHAPSMPTALAIVPYTDMRMMPIRSESNQIKPHKTKDLNV